jgi:uncharacterized protein (TIGR02391 family)
LHPDPRETDPGDLLIACEPLGERCDSRSGDLVGVSALLRRQCCDQAGVLEPRQGAVQGARAEGHAREMFDVLNQGIPVLGAVGEAGEDEHGPLGQIVNHYYVERYIAGGRSQVLMPLDIRRADYPRAAMPFEGIDTDAVRHELVQYVTETEPVNQSSQNFITATSAPRCGRQRAIELTERVRPILDALYPSWADENAPSKNFEFRRQRDACARLIARIDSDAEIAAMLEGYDAAPRLRASEMHALVWSAASAQWSTGHFNEAVLAAAKAVNSLLQDKVGRRDTSETNLVRESFSEKDPELGRPRLRFPGIEDDQTRESMRQGASGFGAGCFQAIRNPVGHLPNEHLELTEQEALERLAAWSLLARWIDQATLQAVQDA